jgi:3-deoxy-D-manno-octulosonic-acid transferase
MFFLYSLILTLVFIAFLPYFAYQAIFNRKYLSNFRERMGRLPDSLKARGRPTIWLHAVSVGETLASIPLIKDLRAKFPEHRLIVSTTTATGQALARSRISDAEGFCYFPFDWKFSVRRALRTIQPQIVVLMESELWLNFLNECRDENISVIVANGRISDRSFKRSRKFGFFVRRLYFLTSRLAMQSQADAERAIALGAPKEKVVVAGNLKYDIGQAAGSSKIVETAERLDLLFDLGRAPLLVAGSTGEVEEEIVLRAFERLRAVDETRNVRLLIAPRHPERFDEVSRLIEKSGLTLTRRSLAESITSEARRIADVILLDTIGELAAVYSKAAVVFIGGSLIPKGGHNILEPALYAKPIIVGPHMENFREMTNEFLRRGALIQLSGASEQDLFAALIELFGHQSYAQQLGAKAQMAVEENRGATARIVDLIAELLGK